MHFINHLGDIFYGKSSLLFRYWNNRRRNRRLCGTMYERWHVHERWMPMPCRFWRKILLDRDISSRSYKLYKAAEVLPLLHHHGDNYHCSFSWWLLSSKESRRYKRENFRLYEQTTIDSWIRTRRPRWYQWKRNSIWAVQIRKQFRCYWLIKFKSFIH